MRHFEDIAFTTMVLTWLTRCSWDFFFAGMEWWKNGQTECLQPWLLPVCEWSTKDSSASWRNTRIRFTCFISSSFSFSSVLNSNSASAMGALPDLMFWSEVTTVRTTQSSSFLWFAANKTIKYTNGKSLLQNQKIWFKVNWTQKCWVHSCFKRFIWNWERLETKH